MDQNKLYFYFLPICEASQLLTLSARPLVTLGCKSIFLSSFWPNTRHYGLEQKFLILHTLKISAHVLKKSFRSVGPSMLVYFFSNLEYICLFV